MKSLVFIISNLFLIGLLGFLFLKVKPKKLPSNQTDKITAQTQKATVRQKEQEIFIETFKKKKRAREAWGLFSYGGFLDDGQFKLIEGPEELSFHYAEPVLLGQKESSKDGQLLYQKISISKKETAWNIFYNKINLLGNSLESFKLKNFDAKTYEYLHLKKDGTGKVKLERLYFDDPYLRKKETKNHQKLLTLFNNFLQQNKSN